MIDAATRQIVRDRAGGRCECCRLPDAVHPLPFHIEHIVARQHGGNDDTDNLAWACNRCNAHKGPNLSGIDPQTGEVVRLFHPRRDAWQAHFVVRHALIGGCTATGRATLRLLEFNALHRVELRAELVRLGLFEG